MTRLMVLLASLSAAGCLNRPDQADVPEVAARQWHRYEGTCTSWLFSYRTGYEYCASPKLELDVTADKYAAQFAAAAGGGGGGLSKTDGEVTEAALRAHGEKVYGSVCAACHQADGKGLAGTFPPLAGAGGYYGDAQNMARIIVHGLNGEIEVLGVKYNGAMPPQGPTLSDYDIAAVATFVRTSFGNADGLVTPDDVKAVR